MKIKLLCTLLCCILLSGCSMFDSVNSSLNYVTEATSYVNQVSSFAERVPQLVEQAATDIDAKASLTQALEEMKNQITSFNGLEAPAFAQDIHQQLTDYNTAFTQEINGLLEQVNSGIADITAIQDSPLFQTVRNITDTLGQIQALAP